MADENAHLTVKNEEDPIRRIFSSDFTNGSFLNPRCNLCRSPFRKDAEKMHDNGDSVDAIKSFLDSHDEVLSVSSISGHLKSHYRDMKQTAAMLDYCDRLDEIKTKRIGRQNDVDLGIRVCYMELVRAISIPTNGDISKEKIRTELILKVNHAMLENIKTFNEMEKQDEAIKAIETKFAEAWKTCIETSDPEQKHLYVNALRAFKNIMEKQE